jgi:hypothetical protein
MILFDPPVEQRSNVIRAIFPWGGWPAQPCRICLKPLDIAASDTVDDLDAEGKHIGWRHDGCPKEGIEDAV